MIDAKDLRIGNWVNREYWNPHPTEPSIELDACLIYSIQSDRVSVRINDKKIIARIPTEKIQPIPLTPEILEKCGFYVDIHYGVFNISIYIEGFNPFTFRLRKGISGLMDGEYWVFISGGLIPEKIKYLHDLQNLYYAVTKKELEYKP